MITRTLVNGSERNNNKNQRGIGISSWPGKVQVNFGTPYLGNCNFLEEARQRQNGYICQFVPPSFIHPSHVHISRYRATSIGELAISGGTK